MLFFSESRSSSASSTARIAQWSFSSQQQSKRQEHFSTCDVSRTTWRVNMRAKTRTTWWVNTQEQSEVSSSRCGQNWSFPASVKTEGQWVLPSKLQAGLMCSDSLSLSFGCPLLVLAPSASPGFLAATWIQLICNSNSLCPFAFFLFCSMNCTLSSTVCTCNLPTEQATSVVTVFFVGSWPLHSRL